MIANDANVEAYVNVHFSVTKKKTDNGKKANNLTGIKKPSDIKDLPNGTQKTQKALKLPGTVKITTTKGEQKASVKWDVKGSSYDPSSAERQIFNVKGTVILPEGVKNPNKISTVIAVSITVNGYQGTEAAASDNKITGIDSNGKYDTNTKITFTAAGAGMDNTNPRKGDTRYQPKSWKITESPVPGMESLIRNIPCQQAGKIYSESYLWTAEIRRLQLEGYRYTVRKYGYFYGITGSSSYCDSESGSDTDKSEICSADGRQYTDHDICDHFDRGCGMYWRNPCIS